jgi:hypothetical protein
MTIENKADEVLRQAKILAAKVESWADFSAQLFDQRFGLVAKTFPDEFERQAFYDTKAYEDIHQILDNLMEKFGLAAGSTPKEKSGKVLVRLPKSVHQALAIEAKREGVSLNQLAVSKLTLPLRNAKGLSTDIIIEAFNDVHDGYSTDWVIVEPTYNRNFLDKCHALGLATDDRHLNHTLMNIRKTPKYKGKLKPTTKRSGFTDYDDYAYAAEIAVRVLQRAEGVTLDRILCDPRFRDQFDSLAMRLAPNQTPVKLRCAALNLRKTHRLKPISQDVVNYELASAGPLRNVNLMSIQSLPGAYAFYEQNRPIFAGETENLKRRIQMHLAGGLPEFLETVDTDDMTLRFQVLPSAKKEARLQWLGGFINRERPLLNYQYQDVA